LKSLGLHGGGAADDRSGGEAETETRGA
jgi:hypothetical protein